MSQKHWKCLAFSFLSGLQTRLTGILDCLGGVMEITQKKSDEIGVISGILRHSVRDGQNGVYVP